MKKKLFVSVILTFMLIIQSGMINGGALSYFDTDVELGKVVEIIDGEVIKVFFYRRRFNVPSIETVKIIGIDTEASIEAFDYTSNRLLGKTVYFLIEDNDAWQPSDMVHANVFYDFEKTFSEELLELGFAKVDDSYKGNEHYTSFLSAEYNAKLYEEGMWATTLSEMTDRINMNTASSTQVQDVFDIEQSLANDIVSYRLHNSFNDLTEVMAVDPLFNAEWFASNRHLMSVVTNINKASYLELTSLIGTNSNAQSIIDDIDYYTRFNEVKDLDELKSIKSFSHYYMQVESYLTLDTANQLPNNNTYVANINSCTKSSFIIATGLPNTAYDQLKTIKKNDYFISTLGEIYTNNTVFGENSKYLYNDHLVVYTDINNAKEFELTTLFDQNDDLDSIEKRDVAKAIIAGRPYALMTKLESVIGTVLYDAIEPMIYVYKEDIPDQYNIHTVPEDDHDDMDDLYDDRYTNFSNINQLSRQALLDLHPDMSLDIVNEIILYREKHPFRFINDLKLIFEDAKQLALYNKIDSFIVFE